MESGCHGEDVEMAVKKLTNTDVKNLVPKDKRYSVRDTEVQGLVLRVEPSGKKLYYIDYREKNSTKRYSYKIGDASVLTIAQARETARVKLADFIRGVPVTREKPPVEPSVEEIFKQYKSQMLIHHRTENAENFIRRDFQQFFKRPCSSITAVDLDNWRGEERKSGKKASSINRSSNAFCAMLRWALENDIIASCPLVQKKVKPLAESDSSEIIRYLSPGERKRLIAKLDERGQPGEKDYLKTIVIVALNTGIRRGALLQLRWDDLNFEAKTIRLRRETAKGDKLAYIPMNSTVRTILKEWETYRRKGEPGEYLFVGPNGEPMQDVRSSWKNLLRDAGIENFRWHDMRHDFASQLVMAGVNILTVKELMTHSKLEQTLRYAHLAPDLKAEAVEKLDGLY